MIPALIILVAVPASALLARAALRLAPRIGLLDVPNERSSHRSVTPRGGGLAIVATALAGMGALAVTDPAHGVLWGRIAAAGLVVAAVGLLDDRRSAPPWLKFVAQGIATAIVLSAGLVVRAVEVPLVGPVPLGVLAVPLSVFWLVGHCNLFNFMDGIDGIAGGHAAAAGAFLGAGGLLVGDPVSGWGGLLLAAASLGFLSVNRPPARIFMGDVGSLFLGFLLALLAVRLATHRPGIPFPVSFLVLGAFLYDAAFTLGRRLIAGENVLEAHRSHLYQRLVIARRSHAEVSALYVGMTLVLGGLGAVYLVASEPGRAAILVASLAAIVGYTLLVGRIERERGASA
jgi:UDP-N-acetylmuramyl pentapeptide phosphotransferase/UDP-N-acetylglucosamine-1-phosphate transferase